MLKHSNFGESNAGKIGGFSMFSLNQRKCEARDGVSAQHGIGLKDPLSGTGRDAVKEYQRQMLVMKQSNALS